MICKKCGAECKDTAKFCYKCGADLSAADKNEDVEVKAEVIADDKAEPEAEKAESAVNVGNTVSAASDSKVENNVDTIQVAGKPIDELKESGVEAEKTVQEEKEPIAVTQEPEQKMEEVKAEKVSVESDKTMNAGNVMNVHDDKKVVICPNCGEENDMERNFCGKCGLAMKKGVKTASADKKNPFMDFLLIIKNGFLRPTSNIAESIAENRFIGSIILMVANALFGALLVVSYADNGASSSPFGYVYHYSVDFGDLCLMFLKAFLLIALIEAILLFITFAMAKAFRSTANLKGWITGFGTSYAILAPCLAIAFLLALLNIMVLSVIFLLIGCLYYNITMFMVFVKSGEIGENAKVHAFVVAMLLFWVIMIFVAAIFADEVGNTYSSF